MNPETTIHLYAYADGSGTVEHRAAGAGVVVVRGPLDDESDVVIECARHLGPGTNNHAELCAVLCALDVTGAPPWSSYPLVVRTDSRYVIEALTRPEEPHERTINGPVIARARWMLRERASLGRHVEFEWIEGHAKKNPTAPPEERAKRTWNHRADSLAKHARLQDTPELLARRAGVVARTALRDMLTHLADCHRAGRSLATTEGKLTEADRALLAEHADAMRHAMQAGALPPTLADAGRTIVTLAQRAVGPHARSALALSAVCALAGDRAFDEARTAALAFLQSPGLTHAGRLELDALMEGFERLYLRDLAREERRAAGLLAEGPADPPPLAAEGATAP